MTKASISISSLSTKDGKAEFLRKAFRRMQCGSSSACIHMPKNHAKPSKKESDVWGEAS
jgi:hypothetical protein